MGIRKPSISVNEARLRASTQGDNLSDHARRADVIRADAGAGTDGAETAARPAMPTRQQVEPQTRTPPREQRSRSAISAITDANGTIDALSPQLPAIKMQVFLLAYPPAPGVSSIFDSLCTQYPSSKSLQMILRRALDDYETMIECGTFQAAPSSYRILSEVRKLPPVQTSRMVASDLVAVARSHFDPLALETSRAFGLKLATAALATFFAAEP